jgi:eukaryotic-like serine/threonine-protein kinase
VDPRSPSTPVQVGEVVDKYRIERIVGIGAMGLVAAARHTTLDRVVAIKFLLQHSFGSAQESIARFLGEARAAARIDSDHVCRVFDVDMLPSGVPYMIMEYLEGNDLEEEILVRGQLDLVEAVDYVMQALDAIAAAHALGIVHRDLKPANLFLSRRADGSRRVKVLDFGISKALGGGNPRLTRESRSLGTPAYMPPEQIRDPRGVDHRADVWSLGTILYELLTGQMAFVGHDVKEVLDRVLGEDPCPIPALRHDVPPDLVGIVGRALARDRDLRWQTAGQFAHALAGFGSVGVASSLASIQREVGPLAAISSSRLPRHPPAPSGPMSVQPMVANLARPPSDPFGSGAAPSGADFEEISRRHFVAHGWAALQTRKRKARSAVLAMATAVFFAGAAAILAYRLVHPPAQVREAVALPASGSPTVLGASAAPALPSAVLASAAPPPPEPIGPEISPPPAKTEAPGKPVHSASTGARPARSPAPRSGK